MPDLVSDSSEEKYLCRDANPNQVRNRKAKKEQEVSVDDVVKCGRLRHRTVSRKETQGAIEAMRDHKEEIAAQSKTMTEPKNPWNKFQKIMKVYAPNALRQEMAEAWDEMKESPLLYGTADWYRINTTTEEERSPERKKKYKKRKEKESVETTTPAQVLESVFSFISALTIACTAGVDVVWQATKCGLQSGARALNHANRCMKFIIRLVPLLAMVLIATVLKGATLEEKIDGPGRNLEKLEHTWKTGMFNDQQRIPGTPKYNYTCYGESLVGPGSLLAFTDTACTRTVAGEETMKAPKEQKKKQGLKYEHQTTSADFTFGDGKTKRTDYAVNIPIVMCGKTICIHGEVIKDSKLPLLLSFATMQPLKFVLDRGTLVCTSRALDGKELLHVTESARIGILPKLPAKKSSSPGPHNVFFNASRRTEYSKEDIQRLHMNLRHPGPEKLWRSVQIWGDDRVNPKVNQYIAEVTKECERCKQVKPPVVSGGMTALPKAHYFRDLVGVDLFYFEKQWYLLVVDFWSRLTNVFDCPERKHENIVNGLLKWRRPLWIGKNS